MSCIEWLWAKDGVGYGRMRHQGRLHGAHRVAYCQANSLDIESIRGVEVIHSCDNPGCVNPDHLSLGSHKDNMADKVSKGRQARGETNARAVLSWEDVRAMRAEYTGAPGEIKQIAARYRTGPKNAGDILAGRTWKE